MCRRSGGAYVLCTIAIAAGILLGVIFPSGFLVFLLSVLLIALGVWMLI
ncbi:MAG: hypothetical protein IIV97_01420 [Oscillospiraceae bacterium]|jgi:hypothetical protein|nr:hypothetical protein [Oscillospiraceae bacterium]